MEPRFYKSFSIAFRGTIPTYLCFYENKVWYWDELNHEWWWNNHRKWLSTLCAGWSSIHKSIEKISKLEILVITGTTGPEV